MVSKKKDSKKAIEPRKSVRKKKEESPMDSSDSLLGNLMEENYKVINKVKDNNKLKNKTRPLQPEETPKKK